MTDWPPCPDETPDACRMEPPRAVVSTCLGWTPQYNRKGEQLSRDPNSTWGTLRCATCRRAWHMVTRGGETTYTPKEPKA